MRPLHGPRILFRASLKFTDPSKNVNFAYVGKRSTGTDAGDYFIVGPGWKGTAPQRMAQISSLNNSVAVIGRAFVANKRSADGHVMLFGDPNLNSLSADREALVLGPRLHPGRPHQLFALGFRRQARRTLRGHDQRYGRLGQG
jgi:hypothetical protein